MYLRILPRNQNGKTLLVLSKSIRDGRRTIKQTVEQLGFLEDLTGTGPGQYHDPITHFREYARQRTIEEEQRTRELTITYRADEAIPMKGANRKNIGYMPLSHLYETLGISQFMANRQRNLRIEYSLNQVFRLLVFARILFPDSKRKTHEIKEVFFEKFDFSLDDVYRSLTLLNRYADALKAYLHQQVCKQYDRTTGLVYYDVTNYYFEIEQQDLLRKKGISKQHVPKPIVQMGLLMDAKGLPVTYELFSGNTNDCETLMPVLDKVKREYDIGRFIVVADRGLNTSNNTGFALAKGDGYIYGQSILKASEEMKEYCLAESGYSHYKNSDSGFKIKSRIYPRKIHVEDIHGKTVEISIDEKQVFFYSEKYARRTKIKRQEALDKAAKLIADPSKYIASLQQGVKKYIKGLQIDEESGEILEAVQSLFLDQERIAGESLFDGYYAVVTSELGMPDNEVIDHYKGLWQIEESFRLTKSELEARPVHVSREDHINAHFLSCFVSLLLIRLVQFQTEHAYPLGRLLEAMRNMSGTLLPNNEYVFDYYCDEVKTLGKAFRIDFSRRFLNRKEIFKMRNPK